MLPTILCRSRLTALLPTLLLWAALLLPSLATAAEIVIPAGGESVTVESGVSLLVEETGEVLSAEQVLQPEMAARWKLYPRKRINVVGERRAVWLRFDIDGQAAAGHDWLVAVDWPVLDTVDFHQVDRATGRVIASMQGGQDRPAARQIRKDPASVFQLDLEKAPKTTVLLRVRASTQLIVPLKLWELRRWQSERYDYGVGIGLLFGILGVMFFYNLSLYVFTREPSFRSYCSYLLAIIGYELALTGFGPLYLWGDNTWLNHRGYPFFAAASFLTAALFFRRFMDLGNAGPVLDRISRWVIGLLALVAVMTLFPMTAVTSISLGLASIGSGIAGIYTTFYLLVRGNVLARYLLLAWSTVMAATFATTLALMGLIDGEGWVKHSQHVGFVVEIVLLSIALAARIKRDRLSKEAAERESRGLMQKVQLEREEKIRAQEHALNVQLKANEELEVRVMDRTAELKRAMENLELANRELAKLSVTDALTKVHNRRYFDETMKKEYDRSSRGGTPLALLLVDIDYFKKINDTVGHLGGDECLKLVAAALTMCVGRSTDLVARYGGEEFAVVLPGVDSAHAMEVAERIRKAVEDIQFIYRGRRIPISVSLGVVARVTDNERPVNEFITEADQALYAAKGAGRNRAMLAEAA